MDQAALLSLIGSVYDKLVQDVADRVQQLSREAVDARIENWMDSYLDDRIQTWAEVDSNLDNRIQTWVDDNLDLEDAAKEAVQNSDYLADFITETVKNNLTFSISVD